MRRQVLGVGVVLALLAGTVQAHNDGRWNRLAMDQRDWLRYQRVPGTTNSCCSQADGVDAQEDIRYDERGVGHYWVSFTTLMGPSGWVPVPDNAVLDGPNPVGTPVVWYFFENGKPKPRCYAPGAKM